MKKINLEEKLKQIDIPKPDEGKKNAAIQAALKEFDLSKKEAEKKVKGFEETGRLTSIKELISRLKGGLVMNRPIIVSTGVAALAILLTVSLAPQMKKSVMLPPTNLRDYGTEEGTITPVTKEAEKQAKTDVTAKNVVQAPASQNKITGKAQKEERVGDVPAAQPEVKAKVEMEYDSREVLERKVAPQEMKDVDSFKGSAPAATAPMEVLKKKEFGQVAGRSRAATGLMAESIAPQPIMAEPGYIGDEYVGRDNFEHSKPNPVKIVSDEPVSTFSIDVDTASYAFVRRAINEGHLPQKDAVRIEELINYFDYDYEVPRDKNKPFKPTVAVYPSPWNPGTRLLHIGIKGYDIVKKERPRSNLVFLIDVSGSMSSPDKLPLLKNSLKMLVEELAPEDTVAIAVYAGNAGTVLEPTSVKEKGKIISALDRLSAGGSTAGGEGIRLAYSLAEANFDPKAVNRVILATDGDFNVGIQNPEELKGFVERKRKTGIYLSVLGFGQGNYNDALMQKLAQNGNGNAAYIDTLSEARKVLVEEAGSTLFTIAKDVKIQVEFNPERVAEYRLIGYESRMLRREDFNNDQVDAGDIGSGHTVTAIYEITPVNSSSRLVDDLRYKKQASGEKKGSEEYAFLKMRYKLPDEEQSRLISVPVDNKVEYGSMSKVPEDIRFAAAVAGFGQILRGDPYAGEFGYDDVIKLAESARGNDSFGYRSEFLNLVRLAKTAGAMGNK